MLELQTNNESVSDCFISTLTKSVFFGRANRIEQLTTAAVGSTLAAGAWTVDPRRSCPSPRPFPRQPCLNLANVQSKALS